MNILPKDLAPPWRAFQGFGETSTPVDIKPDLDEGFLTDFGKLKKDDQKFGFKKMLEIFGKKQKENDKIKEKLSKKKSRNIAQQNQRRQSYRPLPYKDTAAKDEKSYTEISDARETSEESSTTTSKRTSTPTPSESTPTPFESTPTPSESTPTPPESTPTPSESTPTPSESTPTPSESTPTPSESTPTPSESTTTSETTSTSSETEDQESESSPSEESTIIDILDEEEESLIPEIDFQVAKAKRYRKRNRAIGKCFKFFCPCLTVLLYSKKTQYRAVKAMLGFPVGALFGYALHKLVLERFQLSPFANQCLCSILVLCMGISFALSTQIRCMCFLTIPILCGKTGRMYLGTFIISFIIFGPITNITSNARESMRVMSCITALNLNHTVQRFKLMFKPVKEIVMDFVGAGDKIHEKTKQIEDPYKEIEEEIRDDEDVKPDISETEQLDKDLNRESRVNIIKGKFAGVKKKFGSESESKYGMKSEFRCEGIFTKGVKACYKSFSTAYDRCHSYLPLIGYLLCWPMKLTFICDLASTFMGKRSCNSDVAMTAGIGEGIDTAEAVQKEFDKQFGVSMQYKLEIPPEKIDQIMPQDISASIQYQFEKRKRILEFCLNMVNRLVALTFLHVFNASRKYCDRYLKVIEYDNKYITPYFRHIDARRHRQGKKTLLPLKKSEKIELMAPFNVKFSKEEKHTLIFITLRLIGEATTVALLLGFDWIFYEFLMLIQRHAHVTYHQTGAHRIKMTIFGDGFVGNMVRSIMKGFDKKHSVDEVTTTAECLPQPTKLELKTICTIYGLFLLIFILALFQSYFMRMRRVICSFYYPKREKKRILFLYNDRLKKRKSHLKYMRHRIRKSARKQAIEIESGVFFSLRHIYPKCCGWLGNIGLGKRKCLVCEEVESFKVRFVICSEECPFSYCPECWKDIKGMCYVCSPDDDDDSPPSEEDLDDDTEE